MKDVVEIVVCTAIVVFLESFRSVDKRLFAALTLVAIAFIYVGFAWTDPHSLIIVAVVAIPFVALSYYGQTKNFNLIVLGLLLHGVCDLAFPHFSSVAPKGYDIFCITADVILAACFYFRFTKVGRNT